MELLKGKNVLSEIWMKTRNIYGHWRKSEETNGHGLQSWRSAALKWCLGLKILHEARATSPPLLPPPITTDDAAFNSFYVRARCEPGVLTA